MTLLTILEIATNYPDGILIEAIESKDGGWGSFMYMMREGHIHKTILSYDSFSFKTEQEAITAMSNNVAAAIKYYNDTIKKP